ncbi:MAG: hypothetical protein IKG79_02290 [Neisseriaceae bacterium]|nr:hypothetical protein [Neisseriaceae bacterium]
MIDKELKELTSAIKELNSVWKPFFEVSKPLLELALNEERVKYELTSSTRLTGKVISEFTAKEMMKLTVSNQIKNQKFLQLLEEILHKIEETAKDGYFHLLLPIPNNKEDETLYRKISDFLEFLGYSSRKEYSSELDEYHLLIKWEDRFGLW